MSCDGCKCANEISSEQLNALDGIISKYKGTQGNLIPCLHEAQELIGYLPEIVQKKVADGLGIPLIDVYSVVTFYAFFSTKPKGKHTIGVCMGTACYVRGAEDILKTLEEKLDVKPGEVTSDGKFSIDVMRCIGACGLGPVVTVGEDIHGKLTSDKIEEIIEKYS